MHRFGLLISGEFLMAALITLVCAVVVIVTVAVCYLVRVF